MERRSESEAAAELYRGVEELISGQLDSLMLEPGSSVSVPANDGLTCGDLTIHARSRQVLRGGEEIQLTPKEFDILYFLARNRGIVFTKEQIYQAIWEEDYYTPDSNLMAFIRKLRKKIEPNPDAPEYILTIWGIGYKFNDKL
ncbi:winged helix-turn-helix domain-containing protein [Dialister invisus]|uniref:winged helix-turn-helix domain-containing protein n=1 Tax=Dialister invisus TaxID=218538 RepID=UPI003FD85D30